MKKLIIIVMGMLIAGCATSDKALLKAVKEKAPTSANAYIVFDSAFVKVKEDGSYIKRTHALIKILTMKGKADFGSPSFSYTTKYGKVQVKKARVIKKDGKIINVKKDNIKDIKVPAFGKFFLPNVRMVKIVYPTVERGDAIEYVVEEVITNPPMEGEFDDMVFFEETEPIGTKYYEITLPQDLYYRVYNDKEGAIKFHKNGKKYVWYANNIAPIVREPAMPPLEDVSKKLLLSTVKSWKTWSKWYWNLTKDKFSVNDTMKALIDSLLSDKRSRIDSIKALFYYVSNKIRYVATTMNGKKAGYEPFPAQKTFRQKYGVCRDKAALLVAMLRYIGQDAYPVLTNPMIRVEREIKTDQFNHAIVAIKDKNGYTYLDPTAEDIPVFLPFYEQGKGVLVSTPWGEDLSYIKTLPPEDNDVFVLMDMSLDTLGNMHGKMTMKGSIIDQFFRMMVKKIPPEQLKSMLASSIASLGNEASLDTIYYTDPDDFTKPFNMTMEYTVKGFAMKSKDKYVFNIGGGAININGRDPFSLDKRHYPVYFGVPMSNKSSIFVHLPRGYVIKGGPDTMTVDNKYIHYSLNIEHQKDGIVLTSNMTYKKSLIPAKDYKNTRELHNKWLKNLKTNFILERQKRR